MRVEDGDGAWDGGGGGDLGYVDITKHLHCFSSNSFLYLSFQRRRKKSLCAVKHANVEGSRNRRARHYLDFFSCSLMLFPFPSIFCLSASFIFFFLIEEGSWQAVIV